jgi:hypothetical protein
MARAYCTATQVKRLLRTATQKVKTSESYRDLSYNSGNSGSIRLGAVSFLDSYVGNERFDITFSDATSFEVVGETSGVIGTGTRNSTFSCAYFTIASSDWSGVAQVDDVVYFISNSNVSNDDIVGFIDDATNYINNRLGVVFGDSTHIPWAFDYSVGIPGGLQFAAIRFTAYDIFSSVIAGEDIDQESPVYEWLRRAEKAIDDFINWYQKEGFTGTARWRSRDVIFKEIGIEGYDVQNYSPEIDVTADVDDDETYERN